MFDFFVCKEYYQKPVDIDWSLMRNSIKAMRFQKMAGHRVVIAWYFCEFEYRLGEVHSMHHQIKFVSDLRQVDGSLRALRIPPPIKLISTI